MHESKLQQRFPNLQPINSPPSLFTLNGIGTSIYGERDHDPETGTYVKTLCLTVLFVPIFCLRAYRVANAGGRGWYFIGTEPLSLLAKCWNGFLPSCILVGVLFAVGSAYFSSDDYVDGRKLAKADALAEDQQWTAAAEVYRQVATGQSKHRRDAADRLAAIVDQRLDDASPADARKILGAAVQVRNNGGWPPDGADLLATGMKLAEQHAAADALQGMQTFEVVERLGGEQPKVVAFRRKLVEQVVQADPTNGQYVIPFAETLYAEGDEDRARELLEGVQDQLGSSEGARILGQMLAREGRLDEAHALLVPYTEARLQQLHAAEEALNDAFERSQQQALSRLQRGAASDFSFIEYDGADKPTRQKMVDDYIMAAISKDPAIEQARENVRKAAEIVPTALDLGIVMLRRAQAMPDSDQRKAELQRAETTFLAIRGVAGETDEYRLFLGQVYYWLDKHEEGLALFEEMLAANERAPETLLAVGAVLREVGDSGLARAMFEEAYGKSPDADQQQAAALQRSLLADDAEDEVLWLRRSSPDDLAVQASLSKALGYQAAERGDDVEAQRHYRDSIDAYAKLPETAVTLNNSALAYLALYRLDGKPETLDEVVHRLDKAVALSPSDSILLFNASGLLVQVATEDILGGRIDLAALKLPASPSWLAYLYHNQQQHDDYVRQVRRHAAMKKAIAYLDKLLVLSPKNADVYQMKLTLHSFTDDESALRHVWERLESSRPDVSDDVKSALEWYQGTDDAKQLADARQRAELFEKAVEKTRPHGGVSHAIALTLAAGQKIQLARLGERIDAAEVVRLCDDAHRIAPSAGTQGALIGALLFRADQNLATANADYAELRDGTARTLSASDRVAVALGHATAWRQDVLKDADVQRALTLLVDTAERLPQQQGFWHWAMLQASLPREAEAIAARLADDAPRRLARQISLRLAPADASTALRSYWAQLVAEDPAAAAHVLSDLEAQGVKLAIEP